MNPASNSAHQNYQQHNVRSELPKVERQDIAQTGDSLRVRHLPRPQTLRFRYRDLISYLSNNK